MWSAHGASSRVPSAGWPCIDVHVSHARGHTLRSARIPTSASARVNSTAWCVRSCHVRAFHKHHSPPHLAVRPHSLPHFRARALRGLVRCGLHSTCFQGNHTSAPAGTAAAPAGRCLSLTRVNIIFESHSTLSSKLLVARGSFSQASRRTGQGNGNPGAMATLPGGVRLEAPREKPDRQARQAGGQLHTRSRHRQLFYRHMRRASQPRCAHLLGCWFSGHRLCCRVLIHPAHLGKKSPRLQPSFRCLAHAQLSPEFPTCSLLPASRVALDSDYQPKSLSVRTTCVTCSPVVPQQCALGSARCSTAKRGIALHHPISLPGGVTSIH